jgi:dipeptidase D
MQTPWYRREIVVVVTEQLLPEPLWRYFEEISHIPRTSRQERKVLDYIIHFASAHGLESRQDEAGNVVVVRPAHSRYRNAPAVVLQSHLDMVCEKNTDSDHNFESDPIDLIQKGQWVQAKSTSLGADNGIGVAAMLSMLAEPSLQLGTLECLFTVEEEIGLNGAVDLNPGLIGGRLLINLDSEEVGILYVGCAGGRDSDLHLQAESMLSPLQSDAARTCLRLGVSGLRGGHSGVDIHLGGANAVKLMARILNRIRQTGPIRLSSITGGDKDNAIPREVSALITVEKNGVEGRMDLFQAYTEELSGEYGVREPGLRFHLEQAPVPALEFDEPFTSKIIDTLMAVPHGVISMSGVMKDLVETSSNLSSVESGSDTVHIHASHRSSVASALSWVCDVHRSIAALSGSRIEQDAGYPGWHPDLDSKLLYYAKEGVLRATGKPAEVRAIHAGLECGVIKQKFERMDAVSLGPTIVGAHSPHEKVHVESVALFWNILIETVVQIYRDGGAG